MRRVVAILALMLAFPAAVMADGTFLFNDLKPILNQKPALAKYLLTTLDFAEGGMAARVGSNVNERLGGKRLGPYRILAKPKGATGPFIFEITIHTEHKFVDGQGRVTTLEMAWSVTERLKGVEINTVANQNGDFGVAAIHDEARRVWVAAARSLKAIQRKAHGLWHNVDTGTVL